MLSPKTRTALVSATASLTLMLTSLVSVPSAYAADTEPEITTNWRVDFNSPDDLDGWRIFDRRDYRNDRMYFTPDAVKVENGKLIITTSRHCIENDGDPLTEENVTEDACPEGKLTRYTTARVESPYFQGGKFNVDVKGEIFTPRAIGARSAIWLQNDQQYCSKGEEASESYGEIDLVEHYTSNWGIRRSPSTVHLGCDFDRKSPITFDQRVKVYPEDGPYGAPHVWSADVDHERIRFGIDGEHLCEDRDKNPAEHISWKNNAISQDQWRKVMDHPWRVILNQRVEVDDWAEPAKDSDPFPIRRFEIDYVDLSYPAADHSADSDSCLPKGNPSSTVNMDSGQILKSVWAIVGILSLIALPVFYLLKCIPGTLRCDLNR